MIATDPAGAPKRPDLAFLWHRTRRVPKAAAAAAPVDRQTQAPSSALSEFLSGNGHAHTPHPPHPQPPVSPQPTQPTQPTPPSGGTSLNLAPPSPPSPPSVPAPPSASTSLDLSAPTVQSPTSPPPPAAAATTSLDLGAPAAPRPARPAPQVTRTPPPVRAHPGRPTLLTPLSPTVTLTRIQSGIGTFTVEALVSEAVGDLRIGAAYQLRSGVSSTVQHVGGNRFAPPDSRRPVLVAGRDRYERLAVDLRQCGELERLIVYAFSESRAPLTWGGTLVMTTFGGASIELPLESLQGGDVAVLVSLYNVRGEFVLRAEMQTLYGDVREASRAYGFDRITWLDARTPVS